MQPEPQDPLDAESQAAQQQASVPSSAANIKITKKHLMVLGGLIVAAIIAYLAFGKEGWFSGNLSRERALSILKKSDMRKYALTMGGGYVSVHPSRVQNPTNYSRFLLAAEADGLIKIGTGRAFYNQVWEPHMTGQAAEYCLTGGTGQIDGGPFLSQHSEGAISKFIMATPEPLEVTSIGASSQSQGKTISVVQFKIIYRPTPFGLAYARATGIQNEYAGQAEAQAVFAQFDDGWHLERWDRR